MDKNVVCYAWRDMASATSLKLVDAPIPHAFVL